MYRVIMLTATVLLLALAVVCIVYALGRESGRRSATQGRTASPVAQPEDTMPTIGVQRPPLPRPDEEGTR